MILLSVKYNFHVTLLRQHAGILVNLFIDKITLAYHYEIYIYLGFAIISYDHVITMRLD